MKRRVRLTALLLLALWLCMISAPAVFGAPECTCPDCTAAFCAMKKHSSVPALKIVHLSCHTTMPRSGKSFQKGICHHETGPVAFSYLAILTEQDQAAHQSVQPVLTSIFSQLHDGGAIPETPPPKRLSI